MVLAPAGTTRLHRGVLVRLDKPVAAFVNPVAWRWLTGDSTADNEFGAESRDACLAAWRQAGLIENGEVPANRHDELLAAAARIPGLPVPVLTVGVAASCGYCTQLEADLAANAAMLRAGQAGVVVASADTVRRIGAVPAAAVTPLADLAMTAARLGTPSGVLMAPDRAPVVVSGYDQVTTALIGLAGHGHDVVLETPTSCSVNMASGGGAVAAAVAAGQRLIGVGVRGRAAQALAGFLAARSVPGVYVPLVLLVERPQSLFLVYRGGELIARPRTADEVTGLLETIMNGYAMAASADGGSIPVLAGAVLRADGGLTLYPRSWLSSVVKQQSRLRRAGWHVCPDPFIMVSGPGCTATIHPRPADSPRDAWPPLPAPVTEILLDPPRAAAGPRVSSAQLLAQVVNWVARPATASQVHALAAAIDSIPVRTSTCEQLIGEIRAPAGAERDITQSTI